MTYNINPDDNDDGDDNDDDDVVQYLFTLWPGENSMEEEVVAALRDRRI